MGRSDEFVSYVLEMLEGFGTVRAKAMFGGHGIYLNGLISAIVVDDTLYIKADEKSREIFEMRGLTRFSYIKNGKKCFMSYYMAPEESIDNSEDLTFWAQKGYDASLRAKKKRT